jgi:tRNA(Ile)-lysidine synthase
MPEDIVSPEFVWSRLDWPVEQPVLVACSGGADSLALVLLLQHGPWPLEVAHLDHAGRADSPRQAAEVVRFCRDLGIVCHTRRLHVNRWSARYGMSWEAAGRLLRYRWLQRLAARRGSLLVTGHTADDQAETVVMRAVQGTTLVGLAGIVPRSAGLARPLLGLRRLQLQAYLKAKGVAWFDDPGNEDERFLRVRVRREVLPLMQALNPAAVTHLARLAEDALELRRWIQSQPPGEMGRLVFDEWLHEQWIRQNPSLAARWSREHADRIYSAVHEGRPGIWNLPGGLWAEWDGQRLWWGPLQNSLPELTVSDRAPAAPARPGEVVLQPQAAAETMLRVRRPGDLWGMRPLKKMFRDWGVPRSLRDRLPVLAQGNQALWVPGWRVRKEALWTGPGAGGVRFSVAERSGWWRPEARGADDELPAD